MAAVERKIKKFPASAGASRLQETCANPFLDKRSGWRFESDQQKRSNKTQPLGTSHLLNERHAS